jgi:hypothetical protein
MHVAHTRRIYIRSAEKDLPWSGVLSILEELLPATFDYAAEGSVEGAGEIIAARGALEEPATTRASLPSLTIPAPEPVSLDGRLTEIKVHFADDPEVPFPFRGISLPTKVVLKPKLLSLRSDEKLLAACDAGPLWAVTRARGVNHTRSALALPTVFADQTLREVFNGERFLEMVPLIHWIREICTDLLYKAPPLRGCFIFDDPNLHWTRYGCIDFGKIARQAASQNYHVSFATIPLDGWFAYGPAVQLFRKNAARLSLCIHGNNHIKQELARGYSESERVSLLSQAIRRIERLERRFGVQVCRVMVPPHGACSEEMLRDIPRFGFESACISHGSLRAHNEGKYWARSLGYRPSELIEGCPVLPRWALTGNAHHSVLLAAFLGQPLILRGHHQDLGNEVGLLDRVAGLINGLGHVRWLNLTHMSRSNYLWRIEGRICRLIPQSRRVDFPLPEGTTQLIVENASGSNSGTWRVFDAAHTPVSVRVGEPISLSSACDGRVVLEATPTTTDSRETLADLPSFGAFVRRLLTEGRDRFAPV